MISLPKLPKLPRIRLPKLTKVATVVASAAVITAAMRVKLICGLLTAAFTPLQKAFQAVSSLGNLTGASATAYIKKTLNSVKDAIVGQVTVVVNAALNTVAGAVNQVTGAVQSVADLFKNTSDKLSKQGKSIKELIAGELDCISSNTKETINTSIVSSTINKNVKKEFNSLNNNQKKELLENPAKKEEFVNNVTDKVIDTSAKQIESNVSTSYPKQVETVKELETLRKEVEFDKIYEIVVSRLENSSRLDLISYMDSLLGFGLKYYSNEKYPEIKQARKAELQRLRSDLNAKYIKNDSFIITQ